MDNNGGGDGDIDNTVSVVTTEISTPVTASEEVHITQNKSMVVTKVATETSVDGAGDVIHYTITVANDGNVTLTGVTPIDPLLGTLTRGTDNPGNDDNKLDVGETWTYRGSYTVTQGDMDNNGGGDGDIDNTVSVVTTEISTPVTASEEVHITQVAYIDLDKTGTYVDSNGNGICNAGDTITYVFKVTNTGNVTLTNITVMDTIGGVTITGTIASLAPGHSDSTHITGVYTLTQADIDAGSFYDKATVTGEDPADNDVTNTDEETVNLPQVSAASARTVGGIVEFPVGGSDSSSTPYAVIIGGAMAALAALALGVCFARRRWLRRCS
jgi:uncharacterized repeat protein (TIGR01451 family)